MNCFVFSVLVFNLLAKTAGSNILVTSLYSERQAIVHEECPYSKVSYVV